MTIVTVLWSTLSVAITAYYIVPEVQQAGSFTSVLLFITAFNVSLWSIYKVFIYPFFICPLRHLPRANGFIPIIGHSMGMFERPPGQVNLRMMKEVPNHGLILIRGLFHRARLLVTTPDALADVLVNKSYDFEKPPWTRDFLKKFLGNGLLMTEGNEHKHHRKHIMPAFHFRHVKELYPIFWSKSMQMCEVIKTALAEEPGRILDLTHFSTQVTLDIIGLAGLGRDIGSLRNSDDELIKNYEEILEPTAEKAAFFAFHVIFPQWLIALIPWKLKERVRVTTGNLKRICQEFVAEREEVMKNERAGAWQSRDILSLMIQSEKFSNEELVDQLLTFLAAGHETTSSALSWGSYLLSINPNIQTHLREEIHQTIPDPKALFEPGFDVSGLLESMPYLNGVCNEILRLYPSIPVTGRVAIDNTFINRCFVPKDTVVFVAPWAINRNPALWGADAEEFVPERWIDKETGRATMNGGADSNYAFVTFLHGPRSCIGERFARGELRALLAAFVGNFEMQMADPNEKVIAGGTITSKPVNGMKLKLRTVDWA